MADDERSSPANLEMELERARNELISMREKNSELAQEVQHLKMTCSQKDKEKLDLTKENNLLRLKLGSLRHKMMSLNRKLDKQLDDIDKQALSNIVQASGHISRSMELRKVHMHNCQQLDMVPSRSDGGSPSRVGRIPPQSFMGQPIQPVVSLSRTLLNTHARSVNQNNTQRERAAVPFHIQLDLNNPYIPLPRLDIANLLQNSLGDDNAGELHDNDHEDDDVSMAASNASNQEAIIEESYQDEMDESNVSESNLSDSQLEQSRRLDVVMEERTLTPNRLSSPRSSVNINLYLSPSESESEDVTDPIHIQPPDHNPPPPTSWTPDEPGGQPQGSQNQNNNVNLEADSTTGHLPPDENIKVEMERRPPSPVMVIPLQKRTNTKAVVTPVTATVTQATSSVTQATAAQCSRLTPQHETPLAVTPTVRRRRGNIAARGHRTPNARGHTPTATSSRYSPRDRVADSPVVIISRMSTEAILTATTPSRPKSHRKLSTPKARTLSNTATMPSTSGECNQDRAQRRSRSATTPAAATSHRARARATLSPATSDRSYSPPRQMSPFRGFNKTNDESGDSRLRRSRRRSVTPRRCSCCIDEHIDTSTRTLRKRHDNDNSRHDNDNSRQDDNSSPVYKVKRRKKRTVSVCESERLDVQENEIELSPLSYSHFNVNQDQSNENEQDQSNENARQSRVMRRSASVFQSRQINDDDQDNENVQDPGNEMDQNQRNVNAQNDNIIHRSRVTKRRLTVLLSRQPIDDIQDDENVEIQTNDSHADDNAHYNGQNQTNENVQDQTNENAHQSSVSRRRASVFQSRPTNDDDQNNENVQDQGDEIDQDQRNDNAQNDNIIDRSRVSKRRLTVLVSRQPIDDIQDDENAENQSDDDSHANDNKVKKHSRSRSKSKNRQDNDAPGNSGRNVSRVAKKFASRRDTERENDETGRSTSRQGQSKGQGQGQEAGVRSVSCRDSDSDTSTMSDMDDRRRRQRKPVTYREIPLNRKMRR